MGLQATRSFARPLALCTLLCFLGTLLPLRAAAATPDASAPFDSGTGGLQTQGGALPGAGSSQALASVDLATGSAKTSFVFQLEAARGDAQPSLALDYSSSRGVGFAGTGWTLATSSIIRRGASGMPSFTDVLANNSTTLPVSDDYLVDGRLLIPICTVTGTTCFDHFAYADGTQSIASSKLLSLTTGESFPAALGGASLSGWTYFRLEIDNGTRYFRSPDARTWVGQTKAGHLLQYGHPLDGLGTDGIETVDGSTALQIKSGGTDVTGAAYRWDLVRESDSSDNTVVYAWGNQSSALGLGMTGWDNGIRYLTDIYATSVTTLPVCKTLVCPKIPVTVFAHHAHVRWETRLAVQSQSPAAMATTPIWRAVPALRLAGVDVTSATMASTTRQMVRRYHVHYTNNAPWNTVDQVDSIDLEGACMTGNAVATIAESSAGLLPATTNCPLFGADPVARYEYSPDLSTQGVGPALTVRQHFAQTAPTIGDDITSGCAPWAPSPKCGGFSMVDVNADGIADFVYGPIAVNTGNLGTICSGIGQKNCTEGLICASEGLDLLLHPSICEPPGLPMNAHALGEGTAIGPGAYDFADYGPPPSSLSAPSPLVGLEGLPLESPFAVDDPLHEEHATITDLSPGAGGVVYGPWLGQESIDWLWIDATVGAQNAPGNFQLYTPMDGLLEADGTPTNFPNFLSTGVPAWNSGRALDIDGDGLPDQALVPFTPPGSPIGTTPTAYSYLSGRTKQGDPVPFFRQYAAGDYAHVDPTAYFNYATRSYADMDGDGLPDVVIAYQPLPSTEPALQILTNRGNGSFGASSDGAAASEYTLTGGPLLAGEALGVASTRLAFGDLNGDGFGDYAVLSTAGLQVCLRTIGTTPDFSCSSLSGAALGWTGNPTPTYVTIADMDGSGIPQVLAWAEADAPGGTVSFAAVSAGTSTGSAERPGLLEAVLLHGNASIGLDYSSWNDILTKAAIPKNSPDFFGTSPVPRWVVTGTLEIETPGSATQERVASVSYDYRTPIYDGRERSFSGFQKVIETHFGGGGDPGLVRTTTFGTQPCFRCTGEAFQRDYLFARLSRGLPVLVEETDATDPTRLRTTVTQYTARELFPGVDGRTAWFEAPLETDTYLWDPNASPTAVTPTSVTYLSVHPSAVSLAGDHTFDVVFNPSLIGNVPNPGSASLISRSFDYDSFGNLVKLVDAGPGAAPVGQRLQWGLSAGDTSTWSYRVVNRQTGYVCDLAGGVLCPSTLRSASYGYDAEGRLLSASSGLSGSRPLTGRDGTPGSFAAGQPKDASIEASVVSTVSNIEYDAFGNVSTLQGPDGRCVGITYDSLFFQIPAQVAQYLNGCNGSQALTTITYTFDRGFGVPTLQSSPFMAGSAAPHSTASHYDGFGRLVEMDQPSLVTAGTTAAQPALKIQYQNTGIINSIAFQTVDGPENAPVYADHYRFVDGFGDLLAAVDRTGSLTSGHPQYAVTGMHTRFVNGALRTQYKPFTYTGSPGDFSKGTTYDAITSPQRSFTYDGLGRGLTSTDFAGNVTVATYHLGGPNAALTEQVMDPEQQVGGTHAGAYSTTSFDYLGRTAQSAVHLNVGPQDAPADIVTTMTYLATGEVSGVAQGSYSRSVQYDSLGRMVLNTEPNSGTWTYAYNDAGDLVGMSDARGCGENIFHDALGRIVAEDYSPCTSQQAAYTAPVASSSGTLNGDGTEAFNVYDEYGHVHHTYDRAQRSSLYYDLRGRLTSVRRLVATPSGSPQLDSRYAPGAYTKTFDAYSAANRLLTASTGAGAAGLQVGGGSSVTASYSADGSLASATSSYGTLLTSQTVDASGAVLQRQFGDVAQTTAALDYDVNETLSHYSVSRGPWAASYVRNPPSSQAQAEEPTLQQTLTSLTVTPDRVGNPLSIDDASNASQWPAGARPSAKRSLTYRDDYRLYQATTQYATGGSSTLDPFVNPYLASENYPPLTEPSSNGRVIGSFSTYDTRGNPFITGDDSIDFFDRSLGSVDVGATGFGPDQISSALEQADETLSAAYDPAGNMTGLNVAKVDGYAFSYAWDEVGRLASATRTDAGSGASERFMYDAGGRRVSTAKRNASTNQDEYTLSVFDSLVLEHSPYGGPADPDDYEGDTATEHAYLGAGGLLLGHAFHREDTLPATSAGHVHVFMPLTDPLGSTSVVIDHDTSELVERAGYQPYGAVDDDYRPQRWGQFREDIRYTGHWDDSEVGLSYFGARYYSPNLGRFISPDPIAVHDVDGAENPYEYASGSPMRYVDPFGLDDSSPDSNTQAYGPPVVVVDDPPDLVVIMFPPPFADGAIDPNRFRLNRRGRDLDRFVWRLFAMESQSPDLLPGHAVGRGKSSQCRRTRGTRGWRLATRRPSHRSRPQRVHAEPLARRSNVRHRSSALCRRGHQGRGGCVTSRRRGRGSWLDDVAAWRERL